jgi:hypothetical protein
MDDKFTKDEIITLFISLQVVSKISPLIDWEEMEPKLKEYGVNLYESLYGHYLTEKHPNHMDKEVFTRTLAKVFKYMGTFMEAEGDEWNNSIKLLNELTSRDYQISEHEAVELINHLKEKWREK